MYEHDRNRINLNRFNTNSVHKFVVGVAQDQQCSGDFRFR